jgi:hypothetical protein
VQVACIIYQFEKREDEEAFYNALLACTPPPAAPPLPSHMLQASVLARSMHARLLTSCQLNLQQQDVQQQQSSPADGFAEGIAEDLSLALISTQVPTQALRSLQWRTHSHNTVSVDAARQGNSRPAGV